MELTIVDYGIFIGYLLLLYGFVYFKQKKVEVEDFLISRRNLGIWQNMMSINASKTGAILIAYTAMIYSFGIGAMGYFIGMITGYLIFIPFGLKLYKIQKNKYYTLGDYFYKNYSQNLGRFVTFLCVLIMFGFLCVNLVGAAKVLNLFTPIPYFFSVILIMSIILAYVIGTGFKSVVKTDVIQYLAIILILSSIGGFLLISDFTFLKTLDYSLGKIDFTNLIGFFLLGLFFPFSQPELFQRVYASKSVEVFKKSMLWSIVTYFLVSLVLTLISLFIVRLYPSLDPDTAFVVGLYNLLPVGVNGFLLVVLFAAFMSSLDTYIYTGSSSFVQDLFNFNKEEIKKCIRLVVLIMGLLAIIIAISFSKVIDLSFIFIGLTFILGLTVLITWFRPKVSILNLFNGLCGGFIILIVFIMIKLSQNQIDSTITIYGLLGFLLSFSISWLWNKVSSLF